MPLRYRGGICVLIKSKYTVIQDSDIGTLIFNTKNGVQTVIEKTNVEFLSDLNILRNEKNCSRIKNEIIRKCFCVDSGVNETNVVIANYYKQMFDPTDLSFIIMPNNVCNFQCIYCYQEHDKKIISKETIDNFLSAIKDYHNTVGIKHFYAEWFGGEPFMTYDVIVHVTNELVDFFEENHISYHFGATTNGSLLNKERINYLLEHRFDYFQITLDGSSEMHNKTRPYVNGQGSWEKICENLTLLNNKKNIDFRVAVRVNYNNETFSGINELFKFMQTKLDYRFSVFFHTIGKWGGKNDNLFEVIDPALEPYTTLMLMDQAIEYRIEPKTNYDFYNPFRKMCYASLPYHFTLGSDGKLRKCNEEDEKIDKFNVVGTVKNGRIEIDLEKWSSFVLPGGKPTLPKRCVECLYLPICFGQNCPKSRIMNKKNTCPHDLAVMPDVLINKYKFRKKIREHLMGGDI